MPIRVIRAGKAFRALSDAGRGRDRDRVEHGVTDLCHVVGLGPAFVALAIVEGDGEPRRMRTELVPYQLVARVSVRRPGSRGHVGFDVDHAPRLLEAHGLLTPEAALCRAAGNSEEARPAGDPDDADRW